MAFYECIYIIRPDLTTEQVELVIKRVTEVITSNGGQILDTELWGRRQLAYMVKKSSKGFYVFHLVEGGGPLVANLEARLKIDEDILKFQNVSVRTPRRVPTPLAPASLASAEAGAGDDEEEIPSLNDEEDSDESES